MLFVRGGDVGERRKSNLGDGGEDSVIGVLRSADREINQLAFEDNVS